MSNEDREKHGPDEPEGDEPELDDVDVKDLLRQALEAPDGPSDKITSEVHKRIREASEGRFFADGWSTTPAPRATYLVTSLLMLLIVALAYLLLSPVSVQIVP